jgi:hypothetical protein
MVCSWQVLLQNDFAHPSARASNIDSRSDVNAQC